MGVVVELLLGVGGVAGGLVGPWCWMGECHTSQCSACQSCWGGGAWEDRVNVFWVSRCAVAVVWWRGSAGRWTGWVCVVLVTQTADTVG